MHCVSADAPEPFRSGGRGPILTRWMTDDDLLFPNSESGYGPARGDIKGAIAEDSWVIFHGLQVIQIVPEEVHSYCQLEYSDPGVSTCAWRVLDSEWMSSFDQRHLANHAHFLLVFYDDLVEVICRELLFGKLPFELASAIEEYPQLGGAYLRLADSLRKQNDQMSAIANYERYLECNPDEGSAGYARRCLDQLRSERASEDMS